MTAELSPIHIGRLIPPGTPVGMERGLEDVRTCMNAIQNEPKNQNGKSGFMHYHEMGESHA